MPADALNHCQVADQKSAHYKDRDMDDTRTIKLAQLQQTGQQQRWHADFFSSEGGRGGAPVFVGYMRPRRGIRLLYKCREGTHTTIRGEDNSARVHGVNSHGDRGGVVEDFIGLFVTKAATLLTLPTC